MFQPGLYIGYQILELAILAIPVACITRTVVFEELFKEPREWLRQRSETSRSLLRRKFFYLFTCEYCFSHYIATIFIILCRFKMLFDDWRGYLISFFSLIFVANIYLNLYARLRVEISKEKAVAKSIEAAHGGSAAASHASDEGGRSF